MMPKSLAISLPSWVLAVSAFHGDLGLSEAVCGKVGSAHEHFRDGSHETFNGYRESI